MFHVKQAQSAHPPHVPRETCGLLLAECGAQNCAAHAQIDRRLYALRAKFDPHSARQGQIWRHSEIATCSHCTCATARVFETYAVGRRRHHPVEFGKAGRARRHRTLRHCQPQVDSVQCRPADLKRTRNCAAGDRIVQASGRGRPLSGSSSRCPASPLAAPPPRRPGPPVATLATPIRRRYWTLPQFP